MYLNLTGSRQSGRTTALVKIATGLATSMDGHYIMFMTNAMSAPHTKKNILDSLKAAGASFKQYPLGARLDNGSEIVVVPYNIGPTKGRETDCVIMDNVDLLKKEDQINLNISTHHVKMRIASSIQPFKF